ncbi:MAG: LysM peptidoglycan-binding domain-containing protein [Betaproteobacteria bacterium]|nr:LysM peptidoglycan-binding domain-containing protein [Betaproteobacteria bacterium]
MTPSRHASAHWTGLLLTLTLWLAGCASTAPVATAPHPPAEAQVAAPQPMQAPSLPSAEPHPTLSLKSPPSLGLQPPVDIWERIRRGFAMPDLDSPLVRDREQWYSSRPDYILRMTERSRRYIFHIVEELERRNMPTELALLPFIESAFNPEAVSSAKAAGMWQFMPATGKYFDLKQNLFRDERRDVIESTRAALDYLQKLHDMFGHWHLALAAYNWGEGSVGKALARNRARGLPLVYTDLSMPNETRYYVPKLQAVKNIVAQPALFSVQLPLIDNHPFFRSVPIERDIDVAVAVRLAEVRAEDFKALNPQMNRPVILAAGTPQILLPWDNAAVFERNLQAHADRPLASWTAWTAPKTMKVEDAAKQVDMPHSVLRSANNIPLGMLVKAGSTLLVHRKGHLDKDVKESTADNAQLSLTPEVVLRRIRVTARQGDTLATLAARHSVPAASLAGWNRLPLTATLKTGQSLQMYVPSLANNSATRLASRSPAKGSNKSASKASTPKVVASAKGKSAP